MKQIKYIFYLIFGTLILAGCNKKIQELQSNPNNPSSVPPSLILGTILTDMSGTGPIGALGATNDHSVNSWDDVHRWNQYHCSNYDYYDNNIYSWTDGIFDSYLVLKNVAKMDSEATRLYQSVNPYEAIGRFVTAYYFYNLTSLMGDIPQVEALQGAKIFTPNYTPQKQVFQYVLNVLDSANSDFAKLIASSDNTLSSSQDIYYNGDITKWQKLVNSFKLRVLISLSAKASDPDLNVGAEFAKIINNSSVYPIFTTQDDDFEFRYNPGGTNSYSLYPINPTNFGSIAQRLNMAKTYVSALTTINDPRVFVTSEPAWALAGNDPNPAQFKYFVGASTGEPLATMYGNASAGLYSFINRNRYFSNYTGEPNVLVGYKEMLFNIAEAITRGWVTGNAETFYTNGIIESMGFYGIDVTKPGFTAYFLPPDKNSVTQVQPYPVAFDFNTYYAQPAVKLSSTPATAIEQIVMQKYIVCFQNSGYEAYYNARRTGVPQFEGGSGVGNNGIVPVRWAYPVSEQVQNKTNWSAAISNQSFTADDLNQTMWLLK
ncbi:MAG: SusD/RagB family nutrient-binding outer membrane lipoprotein [Bacteroidetes bacterium]|nr:MAG: SusD/RagB family nutrient-binding outer membrane lipoprotein [Bacteroidota bacterium]